jgi:molybdate transport system substrate-binding protein
MMRRALAAGILGLAALGTQAQEREEIVVFAAGSLRAALTQVARAFESAEPSANVRLTFGASGLLRDRISAGERADVFASANMEHPQALASAGKAAPVQRFARNALCALVAPRVAVTAESLLDRLFDPTLKLGISTPKADPSGDYALLMFERVEKQGRAGAFDLLDRKALRLTGGPNSPPPPSDRNVYGMLVVEGQADIFITYCTNAAIAVTEQPSLRTIAVPASVNVSADYGVATLQGARPLAAKFTAFLLGPAGQAILVRQGFLPG